MYRATLVAGGGAQLAIKIAGGNGVHRGLGRSHPKDPESAAAGAVGGASSAATERARCAAVREGALLRALKGEPGILTLHAAFESARVAEHSGSRAALASADHRRPTVGPPGLGLADCSAAWTAHGRAEVPCSPLSGRAQGDGKVTVSPS